MLVEPNRKFNIFEEPDIRVYVERVFWPFYGVRARAPDGAIMKIGWAIGFDDADLFRTWTELARDGVRYRKEPRA